MATMINTEHRAWGSQGRSGDLRWPGKKTQHPPAVKTRERGAQRPCHTAFGPRTPRLLRGQRGHWLSSGERLGAGPQGPCLPPRCRASLALTS